MPELMSRPRISQECGSLVSMRRARLQWPQRESRFICPISVRECNAVKRMAGYSMRATVLIEERRMPFLKQDIAQPANASKHLKDRWSTFSPNATAYIPRPPGESIEAKSTIHHGNYKLRRRASHRIQWPKRPAWRFPPSLPFCISRGGKTWWPGRPIESHEPAHHL